MPVPLPPSSVPAEVRTVTAKDLRVESQEAAALRGQTVDLQQREPWLPQGGEGGAVQLQADSQQYSLEEQRFVAHGNIRMDFGGSSLLADELQVDLNTRIAVASGNVRLVRGAETVTGERLEYNFALEQGVLTQARGVLNAQTFNRQAALPLPNTESPNTPRPVYSQQGKILRFRAEKIIFDRNGWQGEGVRVTNDPFDPPELELSAARAVVTHTPEGTDQLDSGPGFLVFDQGASLPLPSLGLKLGGKEDTQPWTTGYDVQDKGGIFYQQNINFATADGGTFQLQPRFFLQQALGLTDRGNNAGFSFNNLASQAQPTTPPALGDNFGVGLSYRSAPNKPQQTSIFAELNGLAFNDFARRVRLKAEQRYVFDNLSALSFTYAYRERTFNGIFGNQPVSQRLEATFDSQSIDLGNNTNLSYVVGVGVLQAPSDRTDLGLADGPSASPEATLGRLQAAAAITKRIPLYEAEPTPATREFLRYSPAPITPNVSLYLGATSVNSLYTSGDFQNSLEGTVGIAGTLGQFSKDAFDFTQFSLAYSNNLIGGQSPFFFDRVVTRNKIAADLLQQVYGPFRIGIESSWDVDTGREIDRWFTLRYDRRTYGIGLSYSPVQRSGILEFRIDDFNWGTDEDGHPIGPAPVNNGLLKRRR